ncbi:hypothetical protein AQUCO_00100820v1 [Aquilegia coerulea]|uniref:TTF-type domain-containing protein n=1 Tax=Aquilegia coerulea TaxID=218851 RepID=A0A2G5FC32_AQUCA|nr:hypothetical protein AQUCO_00100820v1 [Aquilegia coerulea]
MSLFKYYNKEKLLSNDSNPPTPKQIYCDVDLSNLVADPGLRRQISSYHPNDRDLKLRKFVDDWFDDFKGWLEYSIEKDAVFYLYCFLFRREQRMQGGGKIFTETGYTNWERKSNLQEHVGGVNSAHNKAYRMAQDLLNQNQHIELVIIKQSNPARREYRVHLSAVADVIRFLLHQGLAFRGHDESETSSNREIFCELLEYTADHNETIKTVLQNAQDNLKLTSPDIQKDMHGLSIARLRGQGYDGASNMRGKFNGLKVLILNDNKSAFYVHCYAHQPQLALVAVAKNQEDIALLFNIVYNVVNIVGASCKRRDVLREKNASRVMEAFGKGEMQSGRGLLQETRLKGSGDTRWDIAEDGRNSEQRGETSALMDQMQSFTFIFNMYFMKDILGITDDLSKALQCEGQDIVNAMALVEVCKTRLQTMRDSGVNETITELLLCMACLDPRDSFVVFDKAKLIRFAEFYAVDFSSIELMALGDQLETYIVDVRANIKSSEVNGLNGLARKLVETRKHIVYPLVYLLVTLALTLPVATASNRLRNRMGDQLMNDSLITYIEKDIFDGIDNEAIIQQFQRMGPR